MRKRIVKETKHTEPYTRYHGATVLMLATACLRTCLLYEKHKPSLLLAAKNVLTRTYQKNVQYPPLKEKLAF